MDKTTSSMIFNQEILSEEMADIKPSVVNNEKLQNPEKKNKSFFDTYRRDLEAMKIPDVEQRSLRYIPGVVPDWSEQRRIIAEANRSLDVSAEFRPHRNSLQKTPSQERNTTVLSAYIVDKQQKAEARRQQYRAQKIKDAQLKLNKDRILYLDWKKSMNEDEKVKYSEYR